MSVVHTSIVPDDSSSYNYKPMFGKGKNQSVDSHQEIDMSIKNQNQLIPSPPLSPSIKTPSLVTNVTTNTNNTTVNTNSTTETADKSPVKFFNTTNDKKSERQAITTTLKPEASFPMAALHNYSLKVNAWEKINDQNYRKICTSFINQYYALASNHKRDYSKAKRDTHRRTTASATASAPMSSTNSRKRTTREYTSDSHSDSGYERVRTRRVTKQKTGSSTPLSRSDVDIDSSVVSSPVKKRKTRDTSSAKPTFVDWESLPDYSPSTGTLPNNTRCLATEWKGQPMNLSNDPLLDKLHPAEATLASILRLPCNVYLDSKRRLFAEKVNRLKKNLPFRRTDAQKACRIDVNKASRLFASFEKIGWLEDDNFAKFV